ncbi:MAG: hypothetical protein QM669_11655 [Siphonobacter sp.]
MTSQRAPWRSLYRQTSARFFLSLFMAMLINGVVFRHGHRLADGRIISHAHPFKSNSKGPIQPHSHTSLELLLLDAVTNPTFDLPTLVNLDFKLTELASIIHYFFFFKETLLFTQFSCFSHRGPPLS